MTPRVVLAAALVGTVVVANWLVNRFGLIEAVPFPALLVPAGTYSAGLALGLRDALHEAAGRHALFWVLSAIVAGAAVSYLVGSGRIAIASAAAFLLAELLDLAVYTPIRRNGWALALICSNAVGAVADTVLFLWLSGLGVSAAPLWGQLWVKAVLMTLAVLLVYPLVKWLFRPVVA